MTQTLEKMMRVMRLQTEIIDELSILLLQHISTSELDDLPAMRKMREIAEITRGLEE